MKNPNLNEIVKPDSQRDYELATRALILRSEADRLRLMAAAASTKSQARWYESRAEQLMQERRGVVAEISPAGINYNV